MKKVRYAGANPAYENPLPVNREEARKQNFSKFALAKMFNDCLSEFRTF